MSSVAAQETRLLARLRALVEIESPTEDKAAVDRAGELVRGWAAAQGGRLRRHRQREFGDVLELRFGPERSREKPILLLGHLDTVWPLGTLAQMPWRAAGGRLSGPGVVDMKAGVVMALEAVAATQRLEAVAATQRLEAVAATQRLAAIAATQGLAARHATQAGLPPMTRPLMTERPVTLLLVSEEEVGSPVSRAITERVAARCAAVFVLEPAQGLAYKTARKGVGHYELMVQGVGAHAGVDFASGHSAVREAARLVETVAGFTDLRRGLTVNPGVIHGGTRSNVVAAACRVEVDVRIAKAGDAARIDRRLRSLRVTDRACTLTVTGGINRPPMERRAGTIALFRQARALAKQMGFALDEAATGGGSDGNFTAALGIPTLDGMGAVGGGAHAADEHVVTASLVERTALLAALLVTLPKAG